eukprot:TRINITY_DN34575_c0_g1_i1.p2 TRINITY_DN34575_c0_g1~~TRINITY_DN34575_c0_g1_i1.p2  ORF type:complete len:124 (+),score=31.58 TRINITY_DN34575_c0_g1_i1:43-414(+)
MDAVSLLSPQSRGFSDTTITASTIEIRRLTEQVKVLDSANLALMKRNDTMRRLHEAEIKRIRVEACDTLLASQTRTTELENQLKACENEKQAREVARIRSGPAANHFIRKIAELEAEILELRK